MSNYITKDNSRSRPSITSQSFVAAPSTGSPICETHHPEFIRLPRAGQRCPWTGLSRASLNELILPPCAQVRSVVLRRSGAIRGVRLISYDSLLDFLHGEMEQQKESTNVKLTTAEDS
jgi:hypothetical protein